MTTKFSKTQIDRLGDRLKKDRISDADLKFLDTYRLSFGVAYDTVVKTIREKLGLKPTGRPAKSTTSIREKLLRESIRLTQVQDIAGCRIVVNDIEHQNLVIESLLDVFPGASLVDRRQKPSHGYRAVHVIVRVSGKLNEIQIRTVPQHLWAELSEKMSDVFDPAIKYGGGDETLQKLLLKLSNTLSKAEIGEKKIKPVMKKFLATKGIPPDLKAKFDKIDKKYAHSKERALKKITETIKKVEKKRKKPNDFPN